MVRFGNVLGSSGSVVPLFREQIKSGGPITLTHPDITRYFMTISEAAQLVIQAGAMGSRGDVFVLDMGKPVRIYDLASRIVELSGLTLINERNPQGDIEIKVTGLRPGEKLFEELALDAETIHETRHPDIRIWGLPTPQSSFIERMLTTLAPQRRSRDGAQVARVVRELVPEAPVGAANLPLVA